MIIREDLDGFIRHYSDQNLLIRKVGTDEIYDDVIDVLDYQYEETDMPLEVPEADPYQIIDILTGEQP